MKKEKRLWLRTLREKRGLTQAQLAEQVGISIQHYGMIETGERDPSGFVGLRIANRLNFDMALFYDKKSAVRVKNPKKSVENLLIVEKGVTP